MQPHINLFPNKSFEWQAGLRILPVIAEVPKVQSSRLS